jgi:hypothetical protein
MRAEWRSGLVSVARSYCPPWKMVGTGSIKGSNCIARLMSCEMLDQPPMFRPPLGVVTAAATDQM